MKYYFNYRDKWFGEFETKEEAHKKFLEIVYDDVMEAYLYIGKASIIDNCLDLSKGSDICLSFVTRFKVGRILS